MQETPQFAFFVVDGQDGVGFSHCHDLSKGDGQVIGGDLSGQNAQKHLAHDEENMKFDEID